MDPMGYGNSRKLQYFVMVCCGDTMHCPPWNLQMALHLDDVDDMDSLDELKPMISTSDKLLECLESGPQKVNPKKEHTEMECFPICCWEWMLGSWIMRIVGTTFGVGSWPQYIHAASFQASICSTSVFWHEQLMFFFPRFLCPGNEEKAAAWGVLCQTGA